MNCNECDIPVEGKFYYCFHCKIEYVLCIECYEEVDIDSLSNHPRRHPEREVFIQDEEICARIISKDIVYKIFRLQSNICCECNSEIDIFNNENYKSCESCDHNLCIKCWRDLDLEHEHNDFYNRQGVGTMRMISSLSGRIKR